MRWSVESDTAAFAGDERNRSLLDAQHEAILAGQFFSSDLRAQFFRSERIDTAQAGHHFWSEVFNRGLIHHQLYSRIRSGLADSTNIRTDGELPFSELLTTISKTQPGRESIVAALEMLDWQSRFGLGRAIVPNRFACTAVVPLELPSPRLSAEHLLRAHPASLRRWWKQILAATFPNNDAHPKDQVAITPAGCSLSLLTQNVWGVPGLTRGAATRFKLLGERLGQSTFDIVALQEMWDTRTTTILDCAQFPFVVTSPGFPGLSLRSGLAICSRHPILESFHLVYKNFAGVESVVRKGALAARILLPDNRIVLIATTHLVSPTERLSNFLCSETRTAQIRKDQIGELRDWLDLLHTQFGEEIVLLGDFNAPEGSPEHEMLAPSFGVDLYRARFPDSARHLTERKLAALPGIQRLEQGITFSRQVNPLVRNAECARLDYAFGRFANPAMMDIGAGLWGPSEGPPISDHLGVTTCIRWNNSQPPQYSNDTRAVYTSWHSNA